MCKYPLRGYFSEHLNPTGKRSVIFSKNGSYQGGLPAWAKEFDLPCGRCINCRLEYSRQWAMRILLEAKCHDSSCMLTLTYNDFNLPNDLSLQPDHVTKFLKRLRFAIAPEKLRYYYCGEYGEKLSRPHYHIIIFGYSFPDRRLREVKDNFNYYTSQEVTRLWSDPKTKESYGYHLITDLTFDSAAYVARYVMKKRDGEKSVDHYDIMDVETGYVYSVKPEFCRMSRNPGIAAKYIKQYGDDIYKDDSVIFKGRKVRPPKYFDSKYEIQNPLMMRIVKKVRESTSKKVVEVASDKEIAKLRDHGIISPTKAEISAILQSKRQFKKRGYENG